MRYKHDCDKCVPLGVYNDADLYFCNQSGLIPTVIARYGNDPSNYSSGWDFNLPELKEAKRLAIARGLVNPDI